jgi:hypothetical protein
MGRQRLAVGVRVKSNGNVDNKYGSIFRICGKSQFEVKWDYGKIEERIGTSLCIVEPTAGFSPATARSVVKSKGASAYDDVCR